MFDVAIGEPQGCDRRRRDSESVPGLDPLAMLRSVDLLDVHGHDAASSDASDQPEQAVAAHLVADRRQPAPREVVFEVTVGEADDECSCRHGPPLAVDVPVLADGKQATKTNRQRFVSRLPGQTPLARPFSTFPSPQSGAGVSP